jgi:regulator of RNase E activity RraA
MSSPGSAGPGVPPWPLPVVGPPIAPVDPALLQAFSSVSAATACAKLHAMGITRTFMEGPRTSQPGRRVVGRAVTLQMMPMREDVYADTGMTQEYVERSSALWAVLDLIEPDDVLVVQAHGTLRSGVVGEMLASHLRNRGGVAVVADGGVRDWARIADLGLPVWSLGSTPHYASQGTLFPWAYHVPVAVGGALVLPGDLVVADDDGAVVVPIGRAQAVLEASTSHEAWEVFSRLRLGQGGALRRYYPLDEQGWAEYEQWEAAGRPHD